jgi:hypothetical protein
VGPRSVPLNIHPWALFFRASPRSQWVVRSFHSCLLPTFFPHVLPFSLCPVYFAKGPSHIEPLPAISFLGSFISGTWMSILSSHEGDDSSLHSDLVSSWEGEMETCLFAEWSMRIIAQRKDSLSSPVFYLMLQCVLKKEGVVDTGLW